MPVYEFKCRECGSLSEALLRSGDNQTVYCPDCGSTSMEKLMSSSLIRTNASSPGVTCCGRAERCESPPCSTRDVCRRG